MTRNKLIIGVVAIVFINMLFGWYLYSRQEQKAPHSTSPSPTSTSTPASESVSHVSQEDTTTKPSMVNIYMIALEDNGTSGPKIGCGDSMVAVKREIPATQGVLKAALQELVKQKDQYYGQSGFYNSLYQSNLQVQEVTIANTKATVKLTGEVALGGVCDSPRFEAQIKQTALQFPTVKSVDVFINNKPLTEYTSGY